MYEFIMILAIIGIILLVDNHISNGADERSDYEDYWRHKND